MTIEQSQGNQTIELTHELLDNWATNPNSPVALHLKQKLLPVEGEGGVIFPPTYAGGKYNIDTLSDGTRVAAIDSVGSQANSMEPLFKAAPEGEPENPLARLVPQVTIKLNENLSVSLLDVGHRLGDALVRSSTLDAAAKAAFRAWLERRDAYDLAKLGPTSILFGAWDSRDTHAKLPRIIQSVIRAWNVEELTRSAQYNPPVDYSALEVFSEDEKAKAEGDAKSPLAQRGFVHVPSVNALGGVVARGAIYRDVTINLVALRHLNGSQRDQLRRYILGLSLVVGSAPFEGFLRQGCFLTLDPSAQNQWFAVNRDGTRSTVNLSVNAAMSYAEAASKRFGVGEDRTVEFGKAKAKQDLEDKKTKKNKAKETPVSGTAQTNP